MAPKASVIRCIPLATDPAQHCAFTTLLHTDAGYTVAFRQAPEHGISADSCIRICSSVDGVHWIPQCTLRSPWHPMDLRDPRLFVAPDAPGGIGVLIGVYTPLHTSELETLPEKNSVSTWSALDVPQAPWAWQGVSTSQQHWLWSVAGPRAEVATSYMCGAPGDPMLIWLHRRQPGRLRWRPTTLLYRGINVSEPLVFAVHTTPRKWGCFLRTAGHVLFSMLSNTGSVEDQWYLLPVRAHLSAIVPYAHDTWIVAGRQVGRTPWVDDTVALWAFTWSGGKPTMEALLTLPSKADCGYPGVVWTNDTRTRLLISYYSQHETVGHAARVYIAEVAIR